MRRKVLPAIAAAAALLGVLGCEPGTRVVIPINQRPVVRLTAAPPTYAANEQYFYNVTLNWTSFDPDGRVDHYLIAVVDLPGVRDTLSRDSLATYTREPVWVRTDRSDTTIRFSSTFSRPGVTFADDSHIFLIKAVDNQGAESEIQQRAFFSNTLAPSIIGLSPSPSDQAPVFVTPSVLIDWDGDDPDGVLTKKPVKYKYILLGENTAVTLTTALSYADTIRRYYAPRNWVGWDSTSADTSLVQYTGLIPGRQYMFVVIAFDEAGAYSPVFSRRINMLLLRVTFAGNNSPTITMYNEFFQYTYPGGSYEPLNPQRVVRLEIPANERVTFNWFATETPGSIMRSYRWAVDIQDLNDETERTDQETDLAHWSPKNINTTSATLGPYPGGDQIRTLFIEAEDINGFKSLGMIGFTVVAAQWLVPNGNPRPLAVVKDYRLFVDRKTTPSQTCVNAPPAQKWPTSAELDTFLFAMGGVPWRCYPPNANPPNLSSPGIFKGFDFDSINTRIARVDQTVRLSTLAKYRHVVWISNRAGATSDADGPAADPMSALKYMTRPNRANTLAGYVRLGGKVWLTGGAALETTLGDEWNRTANDITQPAPSKTYSSEIAPPELTPGRMPYDIFKWQSEIKITEGFVNVTRQLGRNATDPFYADLPARFDFKTEAAGDTFPPGRQRIDQTFYFEDTQMEYLSRPNAYYEDLDPGAGEDFVSGLDTLYQATGVSMVQTNVPNPTNFNNVTMTVYPARSLGWPNQAQAILSGFDIWSWRKTQCRALVHFVLNRLWGLPDNVVPPIRTGTGVPNPGVTLPAASGPVPVRMGIRDQRPAPAGEAIRSTRPTRSGPGRNR